MRLSEQLFQTCAADECPREIRRECLGFLDNVRETVPTIVFAATDDEGRDVFDAQVFSGEEKLLERLDGRAVPVDPGKHTFRFVLANGQVLTSEVLVREGDKSRQVRVKMEPKVVAGPVTAPAEADVPAPAAPPKAKPNYLPAWIATSVALVGVASFGTLALLGKSEESRLNRCAPNCAPGQDNTMRTLYVGADISLAASLISASIATYYFIKPPSIAGVHSRVGVVSQGSNLALLVSGWF